MLEQLNDYNWAEVFGECGESGYVDSPLDNHPARVVDYEGPTDQFTCGFSREDVAEIIAYQDGQNDEISWLILAKLNDGRFIFLSGWCDYTGWGCRSGTDRYIGPSLGSVVRWGMSDEERKTLGKFLSDPQ